MKSFLTFLSILCLSTFVTAQEMTLEELKVKKAMLEEKIAPVNAEASKIQGEIDGLNGQISSFPGWYRGASGILGANFIGRNSWFAAGDGLDSRTSTIMGSFSGFVNQLADKHFWRNAAALNLGWQNVRANKADPNKDLKPVADILNLSSLFGYKISSKWAASALGEFRTSVIENALNPGYLDIGAGATWTPIKNMVWVFHPVNYNFVFAKDDSKFTPSLGCKILGDYNAKLYKGVKWRSNFSGFFSYKDQGDKPALHNGTWTNWFGFNLFKGIGVGIEHGLRFSQQEGALLATPDRGRLQNYYVVGLSYSL
jgi:hypothetical protein